MIKTPQTHPDHHVVGHHLGGYDYDSNSTVIYFCDSHDPRCGYWLTDVKRPEHRICISERAVGRTFYKAHDRGDHWEVEQWWIQVAK